MRMKSWMMLVLVGALPSVALAQAPQTDKEKLGYALGTQIGQDIKRNDIDLDPEAFARAIKDALAGNKPVMSEEEMRTTLMTFQQQMREKQVKAMQELADKNKKESDEFLAANKTKEGVVTLPSGVQYKVLQPGKGKKPTVKDTVVAHYVGTLPNGKEFDSSVKRGQPATFPLDSVIPGWKEVLPLMQEGAKWQVVIPPELAYGMRGAGQEIGPNQALIFDIELIEVKKATTAPAPEKKPAKPGAKPQAPAPEKK